MKSVIKKIKGLFCVKEGNTTTPKVTANMRVIKIIGIVGLVLLTVAIIFGSKDPKASKDVVETELHDTSLYSQVDGGGESYGKTEITYINKRDRLSRSNRHENPMSAFSYSGREFSANQIIMNSGNDIPPGTLLQARLVNKLVSSSKNHPVIALVTKDYFHLGILAIPKGTKLLGQSQHDEASRRIQVSFNTAVFPDQRSISFSGMALDLDDDGSAGLKGRYSSRRANRIAGTLLSNFVAGFAEGMQDRDVSEFGEVTQKGSLKNAVLNGAGSTAIENSRQFADNLRETKGTITVPAGYGFFVYMEKETKF
ncbi:MAG TPA: TrbI/VirB10 family protein [Bdellovibrionota bacterium]|nr:TrbI/VirB10 family protein [Bdellovibrionota bacterium]